MNVILEQINSVGNWFVGYAAPMLVQSSVLIAVLLLADLALRRKVRAVFRYWLWMLVLVKLVLPTSLSSPASLGHLVGNELQSVKINMPQIAASPQAAEPISLETGNREIIMPQKSASEPAAVQPKIIVTPVTWQGVVFLIWLAVVIAMGLLLLQRAVFVCGLVAQAKEADSLMNDTLKSCCGQMKMKRTIGLKVSANAASPAVCGLFRPVILVPESLGTSLGAGHLRMVLLHELAHIKRGDLWVNLVQTILQIIYFYNPLLWLANAVIRRIREQAVDEAVQVAMGDNAKLYPQTLLDVAKLAFRRPALSLRLIGVVESKSALKGRIKRMLDRPIPKSAKLGALGLAAILIVGAVLLPMAKAAIGQPEFVIKGTVTDAETGQPIAGAKVGDNKEYNDGKFCTVTDSNGNYEYKTWYEEHFTECEASGYKAEKKILLTKVIGSEKEKVINFALESENTSTGALNESQKLYARWTEERFGSYLDCSQYANLSDSARTELEGKWLKLLEEPENEKYYDAINGLVAIKSKKAIKPLLRIATERIEKDNRYRWMTVRALGIIGDESVVPELIPLVYHYNQNTRFWAQISLVRLTGENFGADWQKWAGWWNSQKGKPDCSTEKVEWTSNPDWADPEKQKKMDEESIGRLSEDKKGETDKSGGGAGREPVVVGTTPTVYADDVSPELDKITVTFNQPMMDQSWSWTGDGETYPQTPDRPYYDSSRTICTLPVKLEAGKVYWVGINSPSYRNFKSANGAAAKRYVILFATRGADGKPTPIPQDILAKAKGINEQAEKTNVDVGVERRRTRLRAAFEKRMARDKATYSDRELSEIEQLYQVANKKWKSQEAQDSLEKLIAKYSKANRTGCAILYLGQMSEGEQKEQYLKRALEDFSNCMYGNGVRVGAFARYLLAMHYEEIDKKDEAKKLIAELIKDYPDAVGHHGGLLIEQIPEDMLAQARAINEQVEGTEQPMEESAKLEKVDQNPTGKWQSVDFVQEIEDFEPGEKSWSGELFLKDVKFMKDGRTSSFFTWKMGWIHHNDGKTKARYQIKQMNGTDYLFLPWLSGDVTIRGEKPSYYVMEQVGGKTAQPKLEQTVEQAPKGQAEPAVLAREFVGLLVKEDFSAATKTFDATMRQVMSPEKLADAWKGLVGQSGAYKKEIGTRAEKLLGFDIVYVTCEFEKGPLDIKVVYNSERQVSGLWFVPVPQEILEGYQK